MINRTNAFAGLILAGLLGLGLYQQYNRYDSTAQPAKSTGSTGSTTTTGTFGPTSEPMVKLPLPDLDRDGKGELLWVTQPKDGQAAVMFGYTHNSRNTEMMPLKVDGPLTLEGSAPRWALKDKAGKAQLVVTVFQEQAEKDKPAPSPDLIVSSRTQAKRYVWVDRGFMKLDAYTVTPGLAVGLVMLGDPREALEAMGGAPDAEGTWSQPLATSLPMKVQFNMENRVTAITYDSPNYNCDFGLKPGEPLNDTAKLLPAHREKDLWVSPTYGLKGRMDKFHKLQSLTIARPWEEESLPSRKAKP